MNKFGIQDQMIKNQEAQIEEFDNLINLAEEGHYYGSTPAPENKRERHEYIQRLKAQRKHSMDVLIALQNGFGSSDAGG